MMGGELLRIKRRKDAIKKMKSLWKSASNTLVIHYSCESFDDKLDGRSPRITSIAVRNLASGQTKSFSIHLIAEEKKVPVDEIAQKYDELEGAMLKRFFDFVKKNEHCNWIHWNMRDVRYGFDAIEHRFRVLVGENSIHIIGEDKKFDLSMALWHLYGDEYIGHPRMEKLVEKNNLTKQDFLTVEEESIAFDKKEFFKLHQSTLRKTDIIANIFERALSNHLKTNSTWVEQPGYTPAALVEWVREHWLCAILSGLVTLMSVIVGILSLLFR